MLRVAMWSWTLVMPMLLQLSKKSCGYLQPTPIIDRRFAVRAARMNTIVGQTNFGGVLGAALGQAPVDAHVIGAWPTRMEEQLEADVTPVPEPPPLPPLICELSDTDYGSTPLGEASDEGGLLRQAGMTSQLQDNEPEHLRPRTMEQEDAVAPGFSGGRVTCPGLCAGYNL